MKAVPSPAGEAVVGAVGLSSLFIAREVGRAIKSSSSSPRGGDTKANLLPDPETDPAGVLLFYGSMLVYFITVLTTASAINLTAHPGKESAKKGKPRTPSFPPLVEPVGQMSQGWGNPKTVCMLIQSKEEWDVLVYRSIAYRGMVTYSIYVIIDYWVGKRR